MLPPTFWRSGKGADMTELQRVLMLRDDLSEDEALDIIQEMRDEVYNGEDPEDVLLSYGLELDYILDLIV